MSVMKTIHCPDFWMMVENNKQNYATRPNCGKPLRASVTAARWKHRVQHQGNDLGDGKITEDWAIRSLAPNDLFYMDDAFLMRVEKCRNLEQSMEKVQRLDGCGLEEDTRNF